MKYLLILATLTISSFSNISNANEIREYSEYQEILNSVNKSKKSILQLKEEIQIIQQEMAQEVSELKKMEKGQPFLYKKALAFNFNWEGYVSLLDGRLCSETPSFSNELKGKELDYAIVQKAKAESQLSRFQESLDQSCKAGSIKCTKPSLSFSEDWENGNHVCKVVATMQATMR